MQLHSVQLSRLADKRLGIELDRKTQFLAKNQTSAVDQESAISIHVAERKLTPKRSFRTRGTSFGAATLMRQIRPAVSCLIYEFVIVTGQARGRILIFSVTIIGGAV